MSRRNRESIETLSGLQELDRLVVQVMRALQSGPAQDSHRVSEDNVIYREKWGEGADETDSLDQDNAIDLTDSEQLASKQSPIVTESWEDGDEVPITERWSEPLPETPPEPESGAGVAIDPEPSAGSVLSEAEIAFIDRTCRWLERRPHRDIILDQIWRRLLPAEAAESGNNEPAAESEPHDEKADGDPDAVD